MMMMTLVKRREQETTIDGGSGSSGITCDHCTAAATVLKSPESIRFVSEVSSPQICLNLPESNCNQWSYMFVWFVPIYNSKGPKTLKEGRLWQSKVQAIILIQLELDVQPARTRGTAGADIGWKEQLLRSGFTFPGITYNHHQQEISSQPNLMPI